MSYLLPAAGAVSGLMYGVGGRVYLTNKELEKQGKLKKGRDFDKYTFIGSPVLNEKGAKVMLDKMNEENNRLHPRAFLPTAGLVGGALLGNALNKVL